MFRRTPLFVIFLVLCVSTAFLILPAYACPDGDAGDNTLTNNTACVGDMDAGAGGDSVSNFGNVGGSIVLGPGWDAAYNDPSGTVQGTIDGGDNDDTITNQGTVNGGVLGGAGDDTVTSYQGQVRGAGVDGGEGDDTVLNTTGQTNILAGGDGNDTVTNNSFVGFWNEAGVVDGGADDDIVTNNAQVGNMDNQNISGTVTGGDGNDTVTNNGTVATLVTGGAGDDTVINNGNIVMIYTDWSNWPAANTVTTYGTLDGGDGNDTVTNTARVALFTGGADNDTLTNSGQTDTFAGGAGDDTMTNTAAGTAGIMMGDAGADMMTVSGLVMAVQGGADDDTVRLIDGISVTLINLDGNAGFDTLRFEFSIATWDEYLALNAIISSGTFSSGTLNIGGVQYNWQNFESLVNAMATPAGDPPVTQLPPVVITIEMPTRTDGRMNWIHPAAPGALFCEAATRTYNVYDVTQVGNILLSASVDAVAAVVDQAVTQGVTVVAAQGNGASIVALPNGNAQLVIGSYSFTFQKGLCSPNV